MIRIGLSAPEFSCEALYNNEISPFSRESCRGKYTVIFFYPLNFTFVCPTELHAFQDELQNFKSKNCQVLAVSIDSVYSHRAWLALPKPKGGIEGIAYPLLSDLTKKMSRDFGVLDEEKGIALRGLFLLDKNCIVHHITINNLGLGRNVSEVLRTLEALQHHEKNGEVCPANWNAGQKAFKPTQKGVESYLSE